MADELDAEFHRRLGELLGTLREEGGLSQDALAVQLQCNQSYVSRIESADRQAGVILLLEWAEALNVPFAALADQVERLWRSARSSTSSSTVSRQG